MLQALELGLIGASQASKHLQRLAFIHGYAHQLLQGFLLFALAEVGARAVAITALVVVVVVALLTLTTLP
jgi:hypothetical protein